MNDTPNPSSESNTGRTRNTQHYLAGRILLATPAMADPNFEKSVVLICQHSSAGAMGIITNKPLPNASIGQLVQQFNLETTEEIAAEQIYFGGPVETVRGFVLHTDDYTNGETRSIDQRINLTSNLEIVRQIALATGPAQHLVALGYAGWDSGQLESELMQDAWLVAPGSLDLLFKTPAHSRWEIGFEKMGIDPRRYNPAIGSA